jgi:hypothetical protein
MAPGDREQFDSVNREQGRFRAHGRVTGQIEGRILHAVAEGPFNLEGIEATLILREEAARRVREMPRWAILVEWQRSMLVSHDAMQRFVSRTREVFSQPIATPRAIAWTFTADVEGAALLHRPFEKLYQELGVAFSAFDSLGPARRWLETQLDQPPGTTPEPS